MNKFMHCFAAVFIAAVSLFSQAQSYPNRPVKIILPLAAGAGTDSLTRAIAQALSSIWKQPVVVDNRPGAGLTIGTEVAAKAPPDGYTLLFTTVAHAVMPTAYPKLSFNVLDMTPVAIIGRSPDVLVVRSTLPVNSVAEFVQLAKSQPGKLNFATPGNGTFSHLLYELMRTEAGFEATIIPYKGATPAITALLAGEVDAYFDVPGGVMPHVKAGKFRALAVTTQQRAASLPAVASMGEAGIRGIDVGVWYGVFAPAGTPVQIVEKLHADLHSALNAPEVKRVLATSFVDPVTMSPRDFGEFVRAEVGRFAEIVKKGNIKFE